MLLADVTSRKIEAICLSSQQNHRHTFLGCVVCMYVEVEVVVGCFVWYTSLHRRTCRCNLTKTLRLLPWFDEMWQFSNRKQINECQLKELINKLLVLSSFCLGWPPLMLPSGVCQPTIRLHVGGFQHRMVHIFTVYLHVLTLYVWPRRLCLELRGFQRADRKSWRKHTEDEAQSRREEKTALTHNIEASGTPCVPALHNSPDALLIELPEYHEPV